VHGLDMFKVFITFMRMSNAPETEDGMKNFFLEVI